MMQSISLHVLNLDVFLFLQVNLELTSREEEMVSLLHLSGVDFFFTMSSLMGGFFLNSTSFSLVSTLT